MHFHCVLHKGGQEAESLNASAMWFENLQESFGNSFNDLQTEMLQITILIRPFMAELV